MVERGGKLENGAVDFEDLIDGAAVAGAFGADEADVEGRNLRMFQPGIEEEVAATETVATGRGYRDRDCLEHLGREF